MNKTKIFDYNVVYDNNDMVDFCKKDGIKYHPFQRDNDMSGLISGKHLEEGLVMKKIELRQISYWQIKVKRI